MSRDAIALDVGGVGGARIVVVGMGQLGSFFAEALARRGAHVVPVRRGDALDRALDPARVIVAVGEDDLASALEALPSPWRDRVVLVENELAPATWRAHGIERPTVACVFFER